MEGSKSTLPPLISGPPTIIGSTTTRPRKGITTSKKNSKRTRDDDMACEQPSKRNNTGDGRSDKDIVNGIQLGSDIVNPKSRWRRIVFTLNNYTKEEEELIQGLDCQWLIYGREIGETGTPHLQGACGFGKQLSLSKIKTLPGFARCHVQMMRGTPADSLRYCSKQDTNFFQKGEIPQPGKRNDLLNAVHLLKEKMDIKSCIDDDDFCCAFVKYSRGLMLLRDLLQTPRDRTIPPVVIWLHGPTGVGKTRAAVELSEEILGLGRYWISNGSFKWYDGYNYAKGVIFDDLRTKDVPFNYLLRLLDRYQLRVEFKGGYMEWCPEYIFVTAPMGPREMWSLRSNEQIEQLERRCTHIVDCRDGINLPKLRELCFPGIAKAEPVMPGDLGSRDRPIVIVDEDDHQSFHLVHLVLS